MYASLLGAYMLEGSATLRVVYVLASITFIVSYTIRLRGKSTQQIPKWLKFVSAFLLALLPALSFFYVDSIEPIFEPASTLIPLVSFAVYFYDRFVFNTHDMKNKLVVFLLVQTLLILAMLLYSLVQRAQAIEYQEMAADYENAAQQERIKLNECLANQENQLKNGGR